MKNVKSASQGLMALQIPPQKDYQTLCEVYNEFTANEPLLIGNIKNVIKNDRQKYDGYSAIDHSDIGPHFHAFDKLDFGSGYKGHTGVQWPLKSPRLVKAVTKDFTLKDKYSCFDMTATRIHPKNIDEPLLVFFTRLFIEAWGDSTLLSTSLLFLQFANTGQISFCEDEARWLFPYGMAYGRKHCRFCVFDSFSDDKCYPGRMTKRNQDMLFDVIWNDCDWDE